MKLKPGIDMAAFMRAVRECTGDVLFISPKGDQLNLKSALSQFLFVILQTKPELLYKGDVVCAMEDAGHLCPFAMTDSY